MILGHGHPAVVEAVQKAILDGFSFGAPTEREVELAEDPEPGAQPWTWCAWSAPAPKPP
jgi:hypothetical protein